MSDARRDLLFGSDGDLVITKGDISYASGAAAVLQRIRFELQFFRGEWFRDTTYGIPYFDEVLVKAPNVPAIVQLLRRKLLEVPGVEDVKTLRLSVEAATRRLYVDFVVSSEFGELSSTVPTGAP